MIKIADWVTTKSGGNGLVTRVAKDKSWADVKWRDGAIAWTKRMPVSSLIVQTSINAGDFEVTDLTREREVSGLEQTP